MISNIKFSLIFEVDSNWENDLKSKCEILNIKCKKNGNMLIIKQGFSLTIFQKKKTTFEKNNNRVLLHINLSGIKNFMDFHSSFKKIKTEIIPEKWILIKKVVDNMTYSKQYHKNINLKTFKTKNPETKYNVERFPGLFFKSKYGGTCILFNNGKINIVGCKNEINAFFSWQEICLFLTNANI